MLQKFEQMEPALRLLEVEYPIISNLLPDVEGWTKIRVRKINLLIIYLINKIQKLNQFFINKGYNYLIRAIRKSYRCAFCSIISNNC